jgi:cyclopropane-fatty-acyl-phospholipid synthase
MAFRETDMVVFQIQMAKRKGIVPQTREYIGREETRLRALEGGYARPMRLAGE